MTWWKILSFRQALHRVKAVLARLVLTVVCVALGVALVVAFQLMNASVLASFLETAEAMAGSASLSITAVNELAFPEEVADQLRGLEGVRLAVPLVRSTTYTDDGSGDVLTVHGVDLANDDAVAAYHKSKDQDAIRDVLEFLNQADSVLLARAYAAEKNLPVGSSIRLVTPRGVQAFIVRGLLEPEGLARTLNGRLVVMDLFAAERAFTRDRYVNQVDLLLEDDADVASVRDKVRAVLTDGLQVEEPFVRRTLIRKSITGFQAMITGFSVLAVIAGLVVSYGRLAAVFEARTWEIGILRAVGLKQNAILIELLKEALILGLSGTVVGLALGIWVGHKALPFLAATTSIAFRQAIPGADVHLPPSALALGLIVGLGSAVVAAAIPALRVAHTPPVFALSMRGREVPIEPSLTRWGLRAALAVVLVSAIGYQWVTQSPAVGLITTAVIGLGAFTLATPFVQGGERVFAAPWRRLFGPIGRHAASQLGRHTRRASLIVATLGIGLGVVLLFGMLAWSFELTLENILRRSLRADLVVTSAFVSGGYWSAPIDETLVEDVRRISGVSAAAGEHSREVEYAGGSVFLKSFDSIAFRDSRFYDWPISDGDVSALEQVAEGDAVLVTRAFAYAHRTRPRDRIQVVTPTGTIELLVGAVTDAPVENAIIMNRDFYRDRWNDTMVSLIHVVSSDSDKAGLASALRARFGESHRLLVRSREQIIDYFVGQVRQAFGVLYLMEAATFVLVLLGIGDALAASVMERTREIGMMRAVGLTRVRLFGMVILEGLTIGVLGLVLAGATGLALGAFWVELQFPAILGWRIDLHFPGGFALAAAGVTLALCLIGSLLPSLRASRMSVADALREE